jgi:CheY-specific phosphatase CheX
MKVNSPDVHSVWFIIPQSLAGALMQNMYAGENVEMDTPVVRDLIAELTNVLGGRLMLLLEELGGEFTLTVPDIGFGLPDISEAYSSQGIVCKVVVDNEHPVIVALCFNPGGVLALD